MKKLFFSLLLLFISHSFLFGKIVNAVLKVPGITWPGTAFRVSSTLRQVNGVKIVNTSVRNKEVYVQFDDSKVKIENLLKALEKAGYKGNVIETKWRLV